MGDQPPLFSKEHPGGEHQQPVPGAEAELLNPSVQPREHAITTAITFLQNPSVKRNPLIQKQQFLRRKGLTEDEIQIACDRAGVFTGVPSAVGGADSPHSTYINMGISAPPTANKYGQLQLAPAKSLFQYVRDVLSSTALVAGVAYAVYLFYKNYIRPLLFGDGSGGSTGSASSRKRRRKTTEELMEDMSRSVEKSVASINQELTRVKEELARCTRQDALQREISGVKSDLDAIKGLLLNRKQFSSPVQPPSIPAWQMQSQLQTQKNNDKIDDAGSASGSSETEVVTKNSDSSLELI